MDITNILTENGHTIYRTPKSTLRLYHPDREQIKDADVDKRLYSVLFSNDYEGYLANLEPEQPEEILTKTKDLPQKINSIIDFDYSKKEPDRCEITAYKYELLELAFYKANEDAHILKKQLINEKLKLGAVPKNIGSTVKAFLLEHIDQSFIKNDKELNDRIGYLTNPLLSKIRSVIQTEVSLITNTLNTIQEMSVEYIELVQRINTTSAKAADEYYRIIGSMQKTTFSVAKDMKDQILAFSDKLKGLIGNIENKNDSEQTIAELQKKADENTADKDELYRLANYFENINPGLSITYYEKAIDKGSWLASHELTELYKKRGAEIEFTILEQSNHLPANNGTSGNNDNSGKSVPNNANHAPANNGNLGSSANLANNAKHAPASSPNLGNNANHAPANNGKHAPASSPNLGNNANVAQSVAANDSTNPHLANNNSNVLIDSLINTETEADRIFNLGIMAEQNNELEKAKQYYLHAYHAGSYEAFSSYLRMVTYNDVKKDNTPENLYLLGHCYEVGSGVPKNREKAIEEYTKSANKDYFYAFLALKRIITVNDLTGKTDPLSYYLLGYCYESGISVKQDIAQARDYYKRAGKEYIDHVKDILE